MSLLDLIFPRFCYGCGKSGRYLCLGCQSKLIVRSVKSPFLKGERSALADQGGFNSRLSLFRYHDPIKAMIHDLKFEFVSDLIPEIALLISRTLKSKFPHLLKYWQDENFILVPIPLHLRRFRWRGFNQTELLAKELSPLISLQSENLLVRTINTLPQTSIKDKLARHTNITNAFELTKKPPSCQTCLPAGREGFRGDWHIVLLDDVYTTGSTMKSAISCFSKNSEIWILTLA